MKILEVREGLIKFEADESICLSSMIKISGDFKDYIAQTVQIKNILGKKVAVAKILYLFDGTYNEYDKTIPPVNSVIEECTNTFLEEKFKRNQPVVVGLLTKQKVPVALDMDAFDKNTLVCIDDYDKNRIITKNLVKQFNNLNKNSIIIDTLGIIGGKKYIAGLDIKLPLDTNSLRFIYQDCLNDATSESKAEIVEIFKELSEYSESVPFLSFNVLKNIIDDMVDNSHIFKLLVLKNKLAKFDKLGYFASNAGQIDKLTNILKEKNVIIDLSKLEVTFQNKFISYLYELIDAKNTNVLFELANTVSKSNLKKIYTSNIRTTIITHSKFKYLNDIKNLFENYIISPSSVNISSFREYESILSSSPNDSYLIVGTSTNNIPFVSELSDINLFLKPSANTAEASEAAETTETSEPTEVDKISSDDDQNGILEELISEENTDNNLNGNSKIIKDIENHSQKIIDDVTNNIEIPESMEIFTEENEPQSNTQSDEVEDSDILENLELETEQNDESDSDLDTEIENNDTEIIDVEIANVIEESTSDDSEELDFNANTDEDVDIENQYADSEEIDEQSESQENDSLIINSESEIDTQDDNLEIVDESSESEIINSEPDLEASLDEEDELTMVEDSEEEPLNQEIEDYQGDIQKEILEEDISDEEEQIIVDDELYEDIETANQSEPPVSEDIQDTADINEHDTEVLPVSDSFEEDSELEEIVELDVNELTEDDIIIDINDDAPLGAPDENIDEQIVQDVDEIYTTSKEDEISDTDLDLIDELNNEDEILIDSEDNSELEEIADDTNDELLEETTEENDNVVDTEEDNKGILETRESSTPIIPVYDADIPKEDTVHSDDIQQGDTVNHVKFGTGVVEKMIKYGNKTLLSINFDNVGRRLLDPMVTEIKKC